MGSLGMLLSAEGVAHIIHPRNQIKLFKYNSGKTRKEQLHNQHMRLLPSGQQRIYGGSERRGGGRRGKAAGRGGGSVRGAGHGAG